MRSNRDTRHDGSCLAPEMSPAITHTYPDTHTHTTNVGLSVQTNLKCPCFKGTEIQLFGSFFAFRKAVKEWDLYRHLRSKIIYLTNSNRNSKKKHPKNVHSKGEYLKDNSEEAHVI